MMTILDYYAQLGLQAANQRYRLEVTLPDYEPDDVILTALANHTNTTTIIGLVNAIKSNPNNLPDGWSDLKLVQDNSNDHYYQQLPV